MIKQVVFKQSIFFLKFIILANYLEHVRTWDTLYYPNTKSLYVDINSHFFNY